MQVLKSATASMSTKIIALIIGTGHEYQRHQDRIHEREEIRTEFASILSQIIHDRNITLVAEEAGDDTEVWERLKREDELLPTEYAALVEHSRVIEEPQSTIAKTITDERTEELRHVDICPSHSEMVTIEKREEAMVNKIMQVLGDTKSVLVICGEDHRAGIEHRLTEYGLEVKSFCFPEGLRHPG